jgi:hypothetical protein
MVYDVDAYKLVKTIQGQPGRVGSLAWNGDVVTSGNEDGVMMAEHLDLLHKEDYYVIRERLVGNDLSSINSQGSTHTGAAHQSKKILFPRQVSTERLCLPTVF